MWIMNADKRFDRLLNDVRFAQLVSVMESLIWNKDGRYTYEEMLDAVYVAQVRFLERNPTTTMIELKNDID
jgi:hypothetical protein